MLRSMGVYFTIVFMAVKSNCFVQRDAGLAHIVQGFTSTKKAGCGFAAHYCGKAPPFRAEALKSSFYLLARLSLAKEKTIRIKMPASGKPQAFRNNGGRSPPSNPVNSNPFVIERPKRDSSSSLPPRDQININSNRFILPGCPRPISHT
jgi:hypothetical protein